MATEAKGILVPLNGSNYSTWKLQCQMALMREGLWSIVNESETPPDVGADEAVISKYQARQDKALATIVLSVDPSLLYLLGQPTDPVKVWTKLSSQFQKKNWCNKLILRRKLHMLRLQDGKSVQEHIKEMTEIFNELAVIEAPLDEEDQVVHLLASLPESYDTLVTALEANERVPSMEIVIDRLLYEERKASERGESSSNAKGLYHKSQSEKKWQKQIRCHYYKKLGHMQKDCYERALAEKRNEKEKKKTPQRWKGSGKSRSSPGVGLITTHALATSSSQSDSWILDSGATCHICCNRTLFSELDFKSSQDVTLGDNRVIKSAGCGTVKIQLAQKDGSYLDCTLYDVLYVPDLSFNLLSISRITDRGKTVTFDDSTCDIMCQDGEIIGSATKTGCLYYLNCKSIRQRVNVTRARAGVNVWHQRFGHLNETSLKQLAKEGLVDGLSSDDLSDKFDVCESCIKGKIHRTPFPKTGGKRADEPLGLVHSYVCGKINSKSLSGGEYFLTFIDDKTRYIWVYILKQKSEVFERFLEWKSMVERSTGRNLKVLHSDNGGEYMSTPFQSYLKKEGIKHELTVPRSPEQNGVAERSNRTLMEAVRAMLFGSHLPQRFWAEALTTAVYLRNRSPTKGNEGSTPHEALMNVKPKVNHLRVFGCVAYSHISKEERHKLDPKAKKCVLLGYGMATKGYRLYDINERRVFYSRDVIFDESRPGYGKEPTDHTDKSVEIELSSDVSISEGADCETAEEVEDQSDTEEEEPVLRRSTRMRKPTDFYGTYINTAVTDLPPEPTTVEEALSGPEKDKWKEAMKKEMDSLRANDVYDIVKLPQHRKTVGCKWIFKRKVRADGSIERYKARLVAQGYSQKPGQDYDETFCPVVRFESVRSVIAMAAQHGLLLHQMDVTSAFLNGDLEEEIYMSQPEGFQTEGENLVCKLKRSLYGLKQAPRCWNTALDNQLKGMGFTQTKSDPCLYVNSEGELFIIAVYVDDILLAGKDKRKMNEIKQTLSSQFEVKDMGELHYFLGVKVIQNHEERSIWIGQPTYTSSIIEHFGLKEAKSVATPVNTAIKLVKATEDDELADQGLYQSAVGSLQYLSTMTRPDITFAVSNVGKFSSKPTKDHWVAVKRIIRYLQGTRNYGLKYSYDGSNTSTCIGYSDSDFGGDTDDRKSTSGYIFQVGGTGISWRSKKQTSVALSTAEAEYIALSQAAQEAIWLRQLNTDLLCKPQQPTTVYEDNQAAISMSKNPQAHGKSKHIEIKYHFIREQVINKNIEVKYCSTDNMIADMLTKGLSKEKFQKLRQLAGVTQSD